MHACMHGALAGCMHQRCHALYIPIGIQPLLYIVNCIIIYLLHYIRMHACARHRHSASVAVLSCHVHAIIVHIFIYLFICFLFVFFVVFFNFFSLYQIKLINHCVLQTNMYEQGTHKTIINTQYSTSPCSVTQQRLCILSHQDN